MGCEMLAGDSEAGVSDGTGREMIASPRGEVL